MRLLAIVGITCKTERALADMLATLHDKMGQVCG